ncbi:MAG: alpha/beta hydrolase [Eubacteriales bacterium]
MISYEEFQQKFPLKETKIQGENFPYRHFQHSTSSETIVLFPLDFGISDLNFSRCELLSLHFSVISMDYCKKFQTLDHLIPAIAELLAPFGKVWLVGSGVSSKIAQLLAQKHPEICKGLILDSPCYLSKNITQEAVADEFKDFKSMKKVLIATALIPYAAILKLLNLESGDTAVGSATPEDIEVNGTFYEILRKRFSKPNMIHLLNLSIALCEFFPQNAQDYIYLEGRALLFLKKSEEETLNDHPLCGLLGAQLNTELDENQFKCSKPCDQYVEKVVEFIQR